MNTKRRAGRFVVVGLFNTALDFSILNMLVFALSFGKFSANIISSSVAMTVSYILNHGFVFRHSEQRSTRQFVRFVAITAFGLFVLQTLIIYLFTHQLRFVGGGFFSVFDWVMKGVFTREFFELNTGKVAATIVTMIWNFKMYERFVFKKTAEITEISN